MGNTKHRNTEKTRKEFRQFQQNQRQSKTQVIDERGVPYVTEKSDKNGEKTGQNLPYIPPAFTVFKALLIARVSMAAWGIIGDCDEVYNYWEPLHYLIYGKGFQTWEYDPKFGLRSYAYILFHTVPGWICAQLFEPNPMFVFYLTKILLAIICSLCETYFYIGVSKEIGANVGRITLGIQFLSAGMFISTSSFLPSSTSMYLVMLSHGAWFQQSYALAIFATALSTFLSWPFAALMGFPIACDILLRKRKIFFFIKWSFISALTILVPQILIDSQYYGKFTLASFNIVKYNIFTPHGPDLYGTEPWTYYLFNGFLNFNLAFILALSVWPLQGLLHLCVNLPQRSPLFLPVSLSQLAMYLWLSVFWLQPHKEERFLFPVYPLICLAAALALDTLQKLWYAFVVKIHTRHYLDHTQWMSLAFLALTTLLSISRFVALYQNYNAPVNLWINLNQMSYTEDFYNAEDKVNVCMGKEWYRFPSSFFLPSNNWNVKFIKSEFKGQLPQPFSSQEHATALQRPNFNDLNREEPSRYVKDPNSQCHFLIDYESGLSEDETILEPFYSKFSKQWQEEMSFDFLDASRSHKFFRAFYVPWTRDQYCHFGKYLLLRNKMI